VTLLVFFDFRSIQVLCFQHQFFIETNKVTDSQDDGFVGGLEIQLVGYAENTKRSKESQPLRDDKGEGNGSIESGRRTEVFFIVLGGPQAQATPVDTHCETRLATKRV
jgi:hypothetical protein